MKPIRLELEGFTAFRSATVVDFEGVDLFALAGPTGAGKTSIIDAMTFALYGAVPRLDERAVAPVISQGLAECRIRFDFSVGGQPYVAVRVVRATKSGATTKEARLERGDGSVVAGDAKALTAAVTDLLGLDFKQFTTCVSLPQGEFARFLHAEPRHRQDLLVKLLDLGLYAEVGSMARQRAALAQQRSELASARLEKLADATVEARAEAAARVDTLDRLRAQVVAAEPELAAARAALATAESAADRADRALALLAQVVVPDGVEALSARVAAAALARTEAAEAEEAAASAVVAAEAALAVLPARAEVTGLQRDQQEEARLVSLAAKGEPAAATAATAALDAADALARAQAAEAAVLAHLQAARTANVAHGLASTLHPGDDCPVCGQVIAHLPEVAPDLRSAEVAAESATRDVGIARTAAAEAAKEQARVETKLAGVAEQLAAVRGRLAAGGTDGSLAPWLAGPGDAAVLRATLDEVGAVGVDDLTPALARASEASRALLDGGPADGRLDALLAALDAVEALVAESRAIGEGARRARAAADREAAAAVDDEVRARREFDVARDRLAALEPPASERADLAADWAALVAWSEAERPRHAVEQQSQRAAAAEHQRTLAAIDERVVTACATAGVEPGSDPRGAVGDALARAEAEVRRIDGAMEEAAELRSIAAADLSAAAIASALANHLKADRFERWLLAEALAQLVAGATALLHELSGNAYSLAVDDKGAFVVVDHVNAEQVRSARTLSGGETFLASLALALALADQVATLAAGGAARLETMLLDEGFGTLDPEALDTVAAALEELGARGRTVGIVTHVQELAERMPVRFEVRKVAGSATVDRVVA